MIEYAETGHDGRFRGFNRVQFLKEQLARQVRGAADCLREGDVQGARTCTASAQVLERALARATAPIEVRIGPVASTPIEQRGPSLADIEAEVAAARRSVGQSPAAYLPPAKPKKKWLRKQRKKAAKMFDRIGIPGW
jgi:hypothetical protein